MPAVPTKMLMIASAATMLVFGVAMIFAPQELLARMGAAANGYLALMVQAEGALYLGFAVLNWMAKDNVIGGIYSRPVALGNFAHFFVTAATLLRALATQRSAGVAVFTCLYVVFATGFGLVVFRGPASVADRSYQDVRN